ncbi:hypothetical protein H8S10_16830 [Clostridium sp. NSJ-49]|uniref:Uncharacterized protein n=1 Tax=Clostridium disporicum TaxID=84024 RepID=A0A174KWC7_9CLOT|nr:MULTISPECIES: hypothetical protein [Clostridium]MBC5627085.1 hypothetical protein [Clostridium sp. NSJ-49]MCD2500307.1 hypothetical protein [Clostridium sp. NSJ-145]MDU6341035.1 hypothetical protein [Clostridium sp.]CUP14756.1 Uncharacterised protein [Clostridium disporicum]
MIKVKIDKNKRGEPIFKLGYKELDDKELRFLKRAIMEGKEIKGMFKYEIPLRFFIPIFNNIDKDNIKVDRYSKVEFLEFSDFYDEKYFYSFEVTPKYMKKWREEGCPNIFKIQIDKDSMEIKKEIIFKKISRI